MSYYTNQAIDITLEVVFDNELSLDDATSMAIEYKTPKGVKGSWVAEQVGSSLHTQVPSGTLAEAGNYYVWVKVGFATGDYYYGTPSTIELFVPGTPVTQ